MIGKAPGSDSIIPRKKPIAVAVDLVLINRKGKNVISVGVLCSS